MGQQGYKLARPLPHLGVECSGVADITLQSLRAKFRIDSLILETMHIDDMFGDVQIRLLIALVEDHKEHIESAHDWCTHGKVCSESFLPVVSSADWIRSSQNRRPGIERSMDTSLCNGYRLLFHGFVNSHLIGYIHLVELVDGAYTVVREHQGTRLDGKVACFLVFHDCCCETGSRGCLSRSVDCTRQEGTNIPGRYLVSLYF